MTSQPMPRPCPLCGAITSERNLREAAWLEPEIADRVRRKHPRWQPTDGGCPACVQQAVLETLLEVGDGALHERIQHVWPLDAEAAFGAMPTPLRMHSDPRFTGRGVTVAILDAAHYPHPDLVQPRNRIRAWVDATCSPVVVRRFGPDDRPTWPGWDDTAPFRWHGLMTSVVAAGNGSRSNGLYRGLGSEADVVFVQARDADGAINNTNIARGLEWLAEFGGEFGVRVVNCSLGGEPVASLLDNPVDEEVDGLADQGVIVVVAAGNNGQRSLVPPATAPAAITVGGIDDHNVFDETQVQLWHSNYGVADSGASKPEVVAPSLWVVAPVLPGTGLEAEAIKLFEGRAAGDTGVEERIGEMKLVTPFYQHVEGTSFAAPIVSSVVACMLQANPRLGPHTVRDILIRSAHPVPGAERERQGAGAVDAGKAISLAQRAMHGRLAGHPLSPYVSSGVIVFLLHDEDAERVEVRGGWNGWSASGLTAAQAEPGLWKAELPLLRPGRYEYKFLLDGARWLDDPANPHKAPDGQGRLNSVLTISAD